MKLYKNRTIDYSKPVMVNRNVREKNYYSIRQKGKVVAHLRAATDTLYLTNIEYIIHRKTQKKVRETGIRNTHAFIKGMICEGRFLENGWKEIVYNPFKDNGFKFRGASYCLTNPSIVSNVMIFHGGVMGQI